MRQYTVQTIRRNVFIAMLFSPFIPVLLALGTGGFLHVRHAQQAALEWISRLSEDHAAVFDAYVDDCIGDLALVDPLLPDVSDAARMKHVLSVLQLKRKEILDIAVLDASGQVVSYAGPVLFKGTHITADGWLAEALERGSGVGDVRTGQMGVAHYAVARRVTRGESAYVLRASLDPEAFGRMLREVRDDGLDIFLINRDGELIAGGGQILTRERELSTPVFWDRVGTAFIDPQTGLAHASRVMRHAGWVLAVRGHSVSLFKSRDSALLFLSLSVVGGGAVVFFSSLSLSGYVEKMLRLRDEEREKLREQLYRAGRLAELGEMAAGFAHEINNPLQIMKSDQAYIDMLLQDFRTRCGAIPACVEDIEEIAGSVGQIKVQIDRCARITHSILRFGRAGTLDVQHIDLAKFIPEVLSMVQKKTQLSGIALRVDIPKTRLLVNVDPGRLQQVILNLVNNAMYAVQEVKDGRAGEIVLRCDIDKDGRVRIEISDNGVGIGPENQKLIFTPFFTTKPPGSGTGLGLSVCHGIVDSMNGVLDFVSRKGEGTTFFITLPRVASA